MYVITFNVTTLIKKSFTLLDISNLLSLLKITNYYGNKYFFRQILRLFFLFICWRIAY